MVLLHCTSERLAQHKTMHAAHTITLRLVLLAILSATIVSAYANAKQDPVLQMKQSINSTLDCVVWREWADMDQTVEGHTAVKIDKHHAAIYGGCSHASTLEDCETDLHIVNISECSLLKYANSFRQ